jgi:hypothetical protein
MNLNELFLEELEMETILDEGEVIELEEDCFVLEEATQEDFLLNKHFS